MFRILKTPKPAPGLINLIIDFDFGNKDVNSEISKNFNVRFNHDKLLRLSEVEQALRAVLKSIPSRPTLIGYIESGKLQGVRHPFNKYYYVYQSSLDDFIKQIRENTS